jgi:hypothetical protein
MPSAPMKSHIRWTVPLTDEQWEALPGSRQGFTAKLADGSAPVTFSVILLFPAVVASPTEQDVELQLLAPDYLPDVAQRLSAGSRLQIYRGPRAVADCDVIESGHAAERGEAM